MEFLGYFTNLPVSFGSEDTIMDKTLIDIEIYDAKANYRKVYYDNQTIKTAGGKSLRSTRKCPEEPLF
jgi:hypothetical protein